MNFLCCSDGNKRSGSHFELHTNYRLVVYKQQILLFRILLVIKTNMTASSYQPIIFPKYWQTDNVKPLMTNIGLPFAVRWPKHDLKREHFHLVVVH